MLRALAVCAAVLVAFPPAALPCGNPVMMSGNKAVKKIAKAERLLAAGSYKQAIREVSLGDVEWEDPRLEQRAHVVFYIAGVRSGSRTELGAAKKYFEERLAADEENPALASRLAEVYLAGNEELEKARKMLEDLVERDLVPDIHAYLALARLREIDGDQAGRDGALDSCRKIARKKSQCKLPKAEATAAAIKS